MHARGIVMMIVIVLVVAAIAGAWWLRSRDREPWDRQ